jgi:hypothetical protein
VIVFLIEKMLGDKAKPDKSRSLPPDLRGRARRFVRLLWLAAFSSMPLLLILLLPGPLSMDVATFVNELFWTHLKTIQIEGCAANCRMRAYTMTAIPISWLASIAFAVLAIPRAMDNWRAGEEALRRNHAPYGLWPNGDPRAYPANSFAASMGFAVGLAVMWAATAFLTWFLFEVAGSDMSAKSTRRMHPLVVSVYVTVIMGILQFLGALAVGATALGILGITKLLRVKLARLWSA